jgi:hypothetical protein
MVVDALVAAGRAMGCALTAVQTLRGSSRTRVLRAAVDGGPRTVIVKEHAPEYADNWARESAALSVLRGRGLPVPDLVAVVDDPPLLVLADAGDGPSLADALLGGDAKTATTLLYAWTDALATLHAATVGDVARFAAALRPDASTVDSYSAPKGTASTVDSLSDMSTVDTTPALLADAADVLGAQLPGLGVVAGAEAMAELRSADLALSRPAYALTPADACPDNNVATPSGLVLLDFEQATVRHVAWDAAYLVVPWPSCWCSWALPAEVANAALARWREALARSVPIVGSPAFDRDLDVAVTSWAFLSTAWFLAGAVGEERQRPHGKLRGPTRQTVIRHRMRLAARRRDVLPALADLAEAVLAATAERWDDPGLADAPAYR